METERLVESLRKFTLDEVCHLNWIELNRFQNSISLIYVIIGRKLEVFGAAQEYGEAQLTSSSKRDV